MVCYQLCYHDNVESNIYWLLLKGLGVWTVYVLVKFCVILSVKIAMFHYITTVAQIIPEWNQHYRNVFVNFMQLIDIQFKKLQNFI